MLTQEELDYGLGNSIYKKEMSFLLRNQHLAERRLHRYGMKSCCFGTTIHLLKAGEFVKQLWREAGHELEDYSDAMGDYICIPNNKGPGYVGREPMELFLKHLTPISINVPDVVIAFYWKNAHAEFCEFGLGHVGISLGHFNGENLMFHQRKIGARFGVANIDHYREDIVNNVLSQNDRPSIETKFYLPDITLKNFEIRREFGLPLTFK
jgi:hypothetical protein